MARAHRERAANTVIIYLRVRTAAHAYGFGAMHAAVAASCRSGRCANPQQPEWFSLTTIAGLASVVGAVVSFGRLDAPLLQIPARSEHLIASKLVPRMVRLSYANAKKPKTAARNATRTAVRAVVADLQIAISGSMQGDCNGKGAVQARTVS